MKKRIKLNQEEAIKLEILKTKNFRVALGIGAMVLWAGLFGFFIYDSNNPMISTCYYHSNIQFRAGNEPTYSAIIENNLKYVVDMYYRHADWKWTLECQGLLIEMVYTNHSAIFDQIQEMNQNGQLELICVQYSHALVEAYPYKDFAESVIYNKWLMEDVYNLTLSNVIVLQEGQFMPAFPLLKEFGFDTIAISRDQFSYQNYYPDQPLMEYEFGGISGCYVMPLIWIPAYEGGAFHHQIMLADTESVNTNGISIQSIDAGEELEFEYDAEKQKAIEDRHIDLEKKGNIFLTMSEWVERLQSRNDVGKMDQYVSESHWTPSRHQSMSRWMSWGTGNAPDGIMLARNYYTRNLVQTAQIMYEEGHSQLTAGDSDYCNATIREALRNLWLAQVSDTTGVNPEFYEFIYGIKHSGIAQDLANKVIDLLRDKITGWDSKIQIEAYNRNVLIDSTQFTNVSLVSNSISELDVENKYGFELEVDHAYEHLHPHSKSFSSKLYETVINNTRLTFEIDTAYMEFRGPYLDFVNNTQSYDTIGPYDGKDYYTPGFITEDNPTGRSEHTISFIDNWEKIHYSPSMAENYTVGLTRSDYTNPAVEGNDFFIVPLAICNGLLYNDAGGYAIIKNTSVNHISVQWNADSADYTEKFTEYDSHYEFIFYKGSLENAHLLANIINCYPTITLEA